MVNDMSKAREFSEKNFSEEERREWRRKGGQIGGKNSYLKNNSEKARAMAQERWRRYREEKARGES